MKNLYLRNLTIFLSRSMQTSLSRSTLGNWLTLALWVGCLSAYAQNGPACATFTNKTTTNGLGNNIVTGAYVVTGPTVYASTNGGLSISTDGGTSFTNKTTANGLGGNFVLGLSVVSGPTVYAATNAGLGISTDGGASFTNKTIANGLGGNVVYGVYAVGSTVYAATTGGLSISTDGGASFTNKTTANGLGSNTVLGVYAIGTTVYAATTGGLSISTDGGASFTNKTTANGLGNNNVNGVYAVGSNVYTATQSGVSISTDGGASFTNKTTANGLGNNNVRGVYVVGTTVYAATAGGLGISTNGGASFTNYTTANGLGGNFVRGVYALGNTIFAGTDGGLSSCADAALPVSLLSFTAKAQPDNTVLLNWKTTAETNNAYFSLERSKDLGQIQPIAKITAAEGASQGHTYTFTDTQPIPGTSYYRLKQVDFDGTTTNFPWVSVILDNQAYGVFPNPVNQNPFSLHLDEPETANISLFTVEGKPIPVQKGSNQAGNLQLKTSQPLPTGVYILKVEERAQARQHRLVVE